MGCTEIANVYFLGELRPKDIDRAAPLFAAACEQDYLVACNNLAAVYLEGEAGIARDIKRAVSLYRSTCDAAHPFACNFLRD